MKRMKRIFASAIILALFVSNIVLAADYETTDLFYVNDYAGVIDTDVQNHIAEYGHQLYKDTGAEIVIVTVDRIRGDNIESYADDLFNGWELGKAGEDNGLLILMSIGDDDYVSIYGTGYANTLALDINSIQDEYLEPYFAVQDYSTGAFSIYGAVIEYLGGAWSWNITQAEQRQAEAAPIREERVQSSQPGFFTTFLTGIFVIAILVLLCFLAIAMPRRRRYRRVYGTPFNPYSRRRVRMYGPGGYWGRYDRPLNPPPPMPSRRWGAFGRRRPAPPHPGNNMYGGTSHSGNNYGTGRSGPGKPNINRPSTGSGGMSGGSSASRSSGNINRPSMGSGGKSGGSSASRGSSAGTSGSSVRTAAENAAGRSGSFGSSTRTSASKGGAFGSTTRGASPAKSTPAKTPSAPPRAGSSFGSSTFGSSSRSSGTTSSPSRTSTSRTASSPTRTSTTRTASSPSRSSSSASRPSASRGGSFGGSSRGSAGGGGRSGGSSSRGGRR